MASENCQHTWKYFGIAEEADTATDKIIAAPISRGIATKHT